MVEARLPSAIHQAFLKIGVPSDAPRARIIEAWQAAIATRPDEDELANLTRAFDQIRRYRQERGQWGQASQDRSFGLGQLLAVAAVLFLVFAVQNLREFRAGSTTFVPGEVIRPADSSDIFGTVTDFDPSFSFLGSAPMPAYKVRLKTGESLWIRASVLNKVMAREHPPFESRAGLGASDQPAI